LNPPRAYAEKTGNLRPPCTSRTSF
jgi:hypothetical protein